MPTIGDKLTAIYDIKNKIREAIVNKGGSLHEKSALADYPQAIYDLPVVSAPADTYNYHPNPAWWDIKTILENDEVPEGYVAVAAFLLVDSVYQTSLDVFDAYKTSDGAFYSTQIEHIWDTSKDKESGEGYKTRYVIAYVKKDSDKWLGEVLTYGNTYDKSACPIACLGVVWNCPVFISSYPQSYYTYIMIYNGKDASKYNGNQKQYYPLNFYKSTTILEYIDVTKKGKLVVASLSSFCGRENYVRYPKCLKKLAPLYHAAVIFNEFILSHIKNDVYKYIYIQDTTMNTNSRSELTLNSPEDIDILSNSNYIGGNLPLNLKYMEIHIPATRLYYGKTNPNLEFTQHLIGGLLDKRNNYSDMAESTLMPRTLKIVVENQNVPEDYIYIPTYTSEYSITKQLPCYIWFNPYATAAGNDELCPMGITNFLIENNSAYNIKVHLIHAYQLNGMAASKLNKFIFDYLEDRTGLAACKMYITSSQNEKLSSTTKQTIARRNWTLTVTA